MRAGFSENAAEKPYARRKRQKDLLNTLPNVRKRYKIMETKEILNAFAKEHPEFVERYNIIYYPCDIHDANKFKILIENSTFPFTTFAEYIANMTEGVPRFEEIAQSMKNSNRACCYTCNKFAYDMERRTEFCKVTNEPTKPWNDCTCNAHEWPQTAGE